MKVKSFLFLNSNGSRLSLVYSDLIIEHEACGIVTCVELEFEIIKLMDLN